MERSTVWHLHVPDYFLHVPDYFLHVPGGEHELGEVDCLEPVRVELLGQPLARLSNQLSACGLQQRPTRSRHVQGPIEPPAPLEGPRVQGAIEPPAPLSRRLRPQHRLEHRVVLDGLQPAGLQ